MIIDLFLIVAPGASVRLRNQWGDGIVILASQNYMASCMALSPSVPLEVHALGSCLSRQSQLEMVPIGRREVPGR